MPSSILIYKQTEVRILMCFCLLINSSLGNCQTIDSLFLYHRKAYDRYNASNNVNSILFKGVSVTRKEDSNTELLLRRDSTAQSVMITEADTFFFSFTKSDINIKNKRFGNKFISGNAFMGKQPGTIGSNGIPFLSPLYNIDVKDLDFLGSEVIDNIPCYKIGYKKKNVTYHLSEADYLVYREKTKTETGAILINWFTEYKVFQGFMMPSVLVTELSGSIYFKTEFSIKSVTINPINPLFKVE